jgi:hypothetical protein
MNNSKPLLIVAALGSGSLISPACAAPITLGAPFLIVDDRAANDAGFTPGEFLSFGDNTVIPNGAAGTTAAAQTTNLSTGATVTARLAFVGSTAIPDQFSGAVAYNSNLTGPWTLNFSNGSNTASSITPSVEGATPPPFASNVTISGSSANPTFAWSYPNLSVDGVVINIYDKSLTNAAGGLDLVYAVGIPGTSNSFTVPSALAGGLTLQLNHNYVMDIIGTVLRDPTGSFTNSNQLAISRAFFDFTPLPAGAPVVNLPSITPAGAYQYTMTVVAGTTYFVDPKVAVGYSFAIGAGDPNFASVLLPAVQSDPRSSTMAWTSATWCRPRRCLIFPTAVSMRLRSRGSTRPTDSTPPTRPRSSPG